MSKILFPIYQINTNNSARFLLGTKGSKTLVFCGLNPSIATKEKSDRTITKVSHFTNHFGYDSFLMINLYAQRTPYPNKLPFKINKKLHQQNIEILRDYFNKQNKMDFVFCWGNNINIRVYLYECFYDLNMIFKSRGQNIYHLGDLTVSGNPRHPSRIPYESKLKRFILKDYLNYISS